MGGAIISSLVFLTITDSTISGSSAVAGNGTTGDSAGSAFGGTIVNFGPTSITGSTFSGNSAVGGNGATGAFAGQANGGAIFNVGPISISQSTFDHNQAIGGSNGNSGPGQQFCFLDI